MKISVADKIFDKFSMVMILTIKLTAILEGLVLFCKILASVIFFILNRSYFHLAFELVIKMALVAETGGKCDFS